MNSVAQPHRGKIRWLAPALALALAATTFALFAPTLGYELVDLDDNAYISQNAVVLGGGPTDRSSGGATGAAPPSPASATDGALPSTCSP